MLEENLIGVVCAFNNEVVSQCFRDFLTFEEDVYMKKSLYLVFAVILLLSVLGWTGFGQKQKTRKPSWEYLTISTGEARYREPAGLNEVGAQGWELVSVGTPDNSGNVALYFKRAK